MAKDEDYGQYTIPAGERLGQSSYVAADRQRTTRDTQKAGGYCPRHDFRFLQACPRCAEDRTVHGLRTENAGGVLPEIDPQQQAAVAVGEAFATALNHDLVNMAARIHAWSRMVEDRQIPRYDLIQALYDQRAWSHRTFGPGHRTHGIIAHIEKELREILDTEGRDLEEWIDVVILALDGAWRAGFDPWQIATALEAKYQKNRQRRWPDWRTAGPGAIEHLRDDEQEGR